jgi:murein L,D-transpeptidase YcbB/YkuD
VTARTAGPAAIAYPGSMRRFALIASSCVALAAASAGCRAGDDDIGRELRGVLSAEKPPAELKGIRWKLARRVYQARDYRPLWVSGRRVPPRTRELLGSLCQAEREGLRPADYDLEGLRRALERVRATRKDPDAAAFAALDLELTARFLAYGADLLAGRLDPRAVDDGWYIRARRASVDSTLAAALRADAFDDIVAPLRPRQPEYAELVRALADYRTILERGGWGKVPGGGRLRKGTAAPALRRFAGGWPRPVTSPAPSPSRSTTMTR